MYELVSAQPTRRGGGGGGFVDPCVFNYNLQGNDEDNGRMKRNILIRRSLICSVAAAAVDIYILSTRAIGQVAEESFNQFQ